MSAATSSATLLDLSVPVADLLREGTHAAHERAEHSRGAAWLVKGELDKEEYIRFLMMLYHVYNAFECALDQHATHPVLAPTHNPGLFARSANLSADISYLLEVPETSWQSHPAHVKLQSSPPPALSRYVGRIQELASSADPSRLLAHAYVRYLGDLSGGQFIRRRIGKAYGLEDGSGLSFYDFRPLGGTSSSGEGANAGEMKRIKEWYRDGMNEGVGDNAELKVAMVEEANLAFECNTALFDELQPPSLSILPPSSPIELPSPLRSPIASASFVEDVGHDTQLIASLKNSGESKTVFESSQPPSSEKTYSAISVIAVIAAFSIAHFALVIGGFTGAKGYAKLDALQQWLDGLFGGSA